VPVKLWTLAIGVLAESRPPRKSVPPEPELTAAALLTALARLPTDVRRATGPTAPEA
jgi:hypothetical protein